MNGLRAVAVALLCCLSMVAGVPIAADGAQAATATEHGDSNVVSADNTTGYLAIPDSKISRTTTTEGQLDVGAAVASRTATLRIRRTEITLQKAVRNADNETERRAAVRRAAAQLSARIDRLETRERRAVSNYAAGGSSDTQFVRTLGVIDTEARKADAAIAVLYRQNDRLEDPVLSQEEIAAFRARLLPLYGPVRRQLAESVMTGESNRVYIETGETDIVLATVDNPEFDDQRYVREAHIRAARGPAEPTDFDAEDVESRFNELYPWTADNQDGGIQIGRYGGRPHVFTSAGVWPLDVGHVHAASTPGLITFFDGTTADVFREFQFNDPELVPTTTIENETTDGDLRLVVETTRAGGPIGISMVDNGTGERVDALVDVNGDSLGETGGDQVWTVAPRGDVTVNATHDGRTVTVETRLD